MYEKRGPKEIPKIKQFLAKNLHFGQNQTLKFLPKAQKIDRPTTHIIVSDLCRETGIVVCLYYKMPLALYFLKTFCPFGWSSTAIGDLGEVYHQKVGLIFMFCNILLHKENHHPISMISVCSWAGQLSRLVCARSIPCIFSVP